MFDEQHCISLISDFANSGRQSDFFSWVKSSSRLVKQQKLEAAIEQHVREQRDITSPHNPEKFQHVGFPVH